MNVTREEFPIKITDIAVEKALNERKNPGAKRQCGCGSSFSY